MVGHLVGFTGNAAIGVAWQIFVIVIVFITSLFTGMSVLVARFAGAGRRGQGRPHGLSGVPHCHRALAVRDGADRLLCSRRTCSTSCNAAPAVQEQALPFLRIMFLFSSGMLVFFMLGGALRSAGDARTPMILGVAMTLLQHRASTSCSFAASVRSRRSARAGAAMGTCTGVGARSRSTRSTSCWRGGWVVSFPRSGGFAPDWTIIRSLFRFGLPTGVQGIAMNIGGVLMLVVHRIARAERGGAGGVRHRLLAALLAHHLDVDRPDGRGRARSPDRTSAPGNRARRAGGARRGALRDRGAAFVRPCFLLLPAAAARAFSACTSRRSCRSARSCCAC